MHKTLLVKMEGSIKVLSLVKKVGSMLQAPVKITLVALTGEAFEIEEIEDEELVFLTLEKDNKWFSITSSNFNQIAKALYSVNI